MRGPLGDARPGRDKIAKRHGSSTNRAASGRWRKLVFQGTLNDALECGVGLRSADEVPID